MKKSILIPVLTALLFTFSISSTAADIFKTSPYQKTANSSTSNSKDATPSDATPGNATPSDATPSDATSADAATDQNTAWQISVPDEATVYVDGTFSFEVSILDSTGKEISLDPDRQRLTAECDGSVARAEVIGQTVYLVGVQNGTTDLVLYLQEKNEEGNFEDIIFKLDGKEQFVTATVTVTAN